MSLSPLTAMEFSWNVPILSMYKWANLMLVAEVCWIQMDTKIDSEWNVKIWLKEAIETKNKARIMELIWGTKFCSQIIKPLQDYTDNYKLMDSNWHEYPKVDWKYNWDEVKTDLLLWKTVSLNDWKWDVLNYKYEESTQESILAEKDSIYGNIDTAEMLKWWVDAMRRMNTSRLIQSFADINSELQGVLNKVKDTKTIDVNEVKESIGAAMKDIEMWLSSHQITVSEEFEIMFGKFKEEMATFEEFLTNNKHSELNVAATVIQEDIAALSALLVKE